MSQSECCLTRKRQYLSIHSTIINSLRNILRHSVATTLLEHGMPLEQIQQFLGHAQLDTTQIYAASTTAMIKESYQQALARCCDRATGCLEAICLGIPPDFNALHHPYPMALLLRYISLT